MRLGFIFVLGNHLLERRSTITITVGIGVLVVGIRLDEYFLSSFVLCLLLFYARLCFLWFLYLIVVEVVIIV